MKLRAWITKNRLLTLLVIGLLTLIWLRSQNNEVEYTPYTATSADLTETIELSGKIAARNSATLRFLAGGFVTYLGAQSGDSVEKWQTLASIDTRQLQKVLEQKLNLYAIQRGTFDNTQDGYKKNIEDGDVDSELRRLLEKNQYQLENTVKDVEYQDLALKLTRLSSPLRGILIQSPISVPNVQVLSSDSWVVVDPATLEFVADLDEADISKISIGQKAKVTLDAFEDKVITSEITAISYAPKETTTGTVFEVKIQIPQDEISNLRLGLNGTASIIIKEISGATSLPVTAVKGFGGDTHVLTKKGKKYEKTPVKIGVESGGMIQILEGLEPGSIVYAEK